MDVPGYAAAFVESALPVLGAAPNAAQVGFHIFERGIMKTSQGRTLNP